MGAAVAAEAAEAAEAKGEVKGGAMAKMGWEQPAARPPREAEVLTAEAFAGLTPAGRRDHLSRLSEQGFWDQAVAVGEATRRSAIAVIASWADEVIPRERNETQ